MKNIPILFLFLLAMPAFGQDVPEWKPAPYDPQNQSFVYQHGRLLGGFNHDSGWYWPWLGNAWGLPTKDCPFNPPVKNFGVHMGKISSEPAYTVNGKPVSPHLAHAAVDAIPNHKDHFRITFIGDDEKKRLKAYKDWQLFVAGSPYANIVDSWEVPANHWSMKDGETGAPGFIAPGDPTIYLQSPDGRVLHRQDDYNGPMDFQAIRKAIDEYDYRRDPDRRYEGKWPLWMRIILGLICVVFVLGVMAIGVYFLWKLSKPKQAKPTANADPIVLQPVTDPKPAPKEVPKEKPVTVLVLTPAQEELIRGLSKPPESPSPNPTKEEKK